MMTTAKTAPSLPRHSLRLWPGVAAVLLQWVSWAVVPVVAPDQGGTGMIVAFACALLVLIWWLGFSRAPWSERVGALVLMVIAVVATSYVVHASISNGFMGRMLFVYAIPAMCLALVAWAVIARNLTGGPRRAALVAAVLLACSVFTVIRTGGISGDADSELHWRWTPTPEERLLAQATREEEPIPAPTAPAAAPPPAAPPASEKSDPPAASIASPTPAAPSADAVKAPAKPDAARATAEPAAAKADPVYVAAEWPGFRGADRDSIVHAVKIDTDWSRSAPAELWRRPIGPGWSSFAVQGQHVFTQEQRGEDEIVSCYDLTTGAPVWRHRDAARFWESNGGAGPRSTPTLHNGRVYAHGATGIVNALDARTGAVIWSRNAATDTGAPMPGWGFTSSPLVVGDALVVSSSGRLVSYELATGKQVWTYKTGGGSYSSPHLATIDGVEQIILLNGAGVAAVAAADGTLLWQNAWSGTPMVQPAFTADGDVLITSGDAMGGNGIRRLSVTRGEGGWTVQERWTSTGLKPYFNDFVVHNGYAFGFDGSILACIDLKDGARKWKGGRYGHGQIMLLPEQNLLFVLSEEGELALVAAAPDKFTEVARAPAIEGKTWNHPALVGDVLLVRNGEEMAAFRLPGAER